MSGKINAPISKRELQSLNKWMMRNTEIQPREDGNQNKRAAKPVQRFSNSHDSSAVIIARRRQQQRQKQRLLKKTKEIIKENARCSTSGSSSTSSSVLSIDFKSIPSKQTKKPIRGI